MPRTQRIEIPTIHYCLYTAYPVQGHRGSGACPRPSGQRGRGDGGYVVVSAEYFRLFSLLHALQHRQIASLSKVCGMEGWIGLRQRRMCM